MSQGVDFLVFGGKGYFGSHLVKALQKQNRNFVSSSARVEYRDQVERDIAAHNPKYVLNAAGLAGTPNIVREKRPSIVRIVVDSRQEKKFPTRFKSLRSYPFVAAEFGFMFA